MKILNLYAGIGGNRQLWGDEHEITAVEIDPEIAAIYKDLYPNDNVIIGDAHEYLIKHFREYDFIWSSPPCPTHSRMRNLKNNCEELETVYPDMKLYQEIILLKHFFKGKWVVENVISYYDPLIKPYQLDNHYFWSNFIITNNSTKVFRDIRNGGVQEKQKTRNINLDKYNIPSTKKSKLLNNMVFGEVGLRVLQQATKDIQITL